MPGRLLDNRWLIPAVTALSLIASLTMAMQMDLATGDAVLSEYGPVQIGSAGLHFVAAGVALLFWRRAPGWFSLLALCALLMGLRELDLHKALTTHGIFSTKLYARDYVPVHEKLIGGAIVLTIAGLLIWRGRAALADWRRMWAERSPAVTGAITLLAFVPAIKLLDGAGRMMEDRGYVLTRASEIWLRGFEELAELALPALVMLLILQSARSLARKTAPLP